ncbi:MAG TPA: toprim domain-containing protein, partial [Gemmatimonadales bacterium]|nr:toprim domain-containing protein [Gemmatimonadales bacterium]
AADWFARQLRESPEAEIARNYLESRHVTLEQAQVNGLGFGPRGSAFVDAMKGLGLREEVLLEAGLIVKREDGTKVPRFRGRLLFPIHDLRSRVVAFSGRILGEGEPKYLNSPETPIFHKGQLLYNLHVAKHGMRKTERAILVEGQFDVLRTSLAGFEEVVAPLGTGLTDDQAELLRRHTGQVILLYDSDEPGLRATFRAGDVLLRHKLRVNVATLPEGEDPDTLVEKKGASALEQALKDSVDVMERKIQILERKGFFGTLPGRRRALDRLLPTIRATADSVTRDFYVGLVSEAAKISRDALERELKEKPALADTGDLSINAPAVIQLPQSIEKWVALLVLEGSPWREAVLAKCKPEELQFPPYRQVVTAVLSNRLEDLETIPARTYEALREEGLSPFTAQEVLDYISSNIEGQPLKEQLRELDRQIVLAKGKEQELLVAKKQAVWNELRKKQPQLFKAGRKGAPGS